MKLALKTPPKVDKFATAPSSSMLGEINPTGGRYGAGVIPGVSLCTRGEALGHGFWIDSFAIAQVAEMCNSNPKLLKSRFSHPSMCSDGTGKAIGTIENCSVVGDQAIGDLHFYQTATDTPDGNLAKYVMSLAAEDPKNFGLSIVFEHDDDAEELFICENTKPVVLKDQSGQVRETEAEFISPDPLNVENYPHVRIAELCAADVVDDPAANPQGLFHRKSESVLSQGKQILDFVFGRGKTPQATEFGIAPERVKEFVTKYLADAGLSVTPIQKGNKNMPKPKGKLAKAGQQTPEDDTTTEGETPPAEDQPECESEATPEDKPACDSEAMPEDKPACEEESMPEDKPACEDESKKQCSTQQLSRFISKFGAENGAAWTIEGIPYETALERHCEKLSAELADANARLAALAKDGADPLKFSFPSKGGDDKSGGPSEKQVAQLGESRAKIAAAIKLPEKK